MRQDGRPAAGKAGTRRSGRRCNLARPGSRTASCTQPLRHSRPMPALRSMMRSIASGVVSMMNSRRTGSWISTICQGRPVRRSLEAPSMTPSRAARLCGSFVPQPKPALST